MTIIRCGLVALSLCLHVSAETATAASTASRECSSSKVKAAGKAVYAGALCRQKALAHDVAIDPECEAKLQDKLSTAYAKADAKGGCLVTGDAATTQAQVDACLADLAASIAGDAKCAAAKTKATGRNAYAKAKCWQKSYLAGASAGPACLDDADAKLARAIDKADGYGTCSDAAPVLETLVDECIFSIIADDAPADSCPLNDDTTETVNVHPDGCAVLKRYTDDCESGRLADGLSGFWLEFSCRVTLANGGATITAQSDGRPDYFSNYFPDTDDCWEDYAGAIQNPNEIVAQDYMVDFPTTPDTVPQSMAGMLAVVGLSVNGVPIFGNFAAPGDNIFDEAATFDRCGAHPQVAGKYHYHSEPYAITYDDANFVGVMRDGYPVYGRKDLDDTYPALDAYGGHTGVTPHSPDTPVYHYHVNEQVNPENPSDTQWFLTKGTYRGTPGAVCTGC